MICKKLELKRKRVLVAAFEYDGGQLNAKHSTDMRQDRERHTEKGCQWAKGGLPGIFGLLCLLREDLCSTLLNTTILCRLVTVCAILYASVLPLHCVL